MYEHEHEQQPQQEPAPGGGQATDAQTDEAMQQAGGDSSVGDEVMDILADVEQKFTRLREVQRQHDEELTTLNQRREALYEHEREVTAELDRLRQQQQTLEDERGAVEAQRQELAQQSEALEQQRNELNEQHRQFETLEQSLQSQREQLQQSTQQAAQQRQQLEQQQQQWNEQRGRSEQELKAQFDAIEQKRSELERLEREQQSSAETLQQLEDELNERQSRFEQQREQWQQQQAIAERELNERASSIDQREQQLGALQETLEAQQQQLAEVQKSVEQRGVELDERAARLEAEHKRYEELLEEASRSEQAAGEQRDAAQEKLAETQQAAEQAGRELQESRQQLAEMEQQLNETAAQLTDACKERDAGRQQVESLNAQMHDLQKENERQKSRLAESEKRLSTAGEKLRHFAELLNEQAPQLERGAQALAMVEDQKHQIEQLTEQLAEARRAGNPDELKRKEQRIKDLTAALQQARGQISGENDTANLQLQITELTRQNDDLRVQLEKSTLAQQQAQKQLKQLTEAREQDRTSSAQHSHVLEAVRAEHESELESLRSEHEQSMDELRSERDARVQSMKEEIDRLTASLEEVSEAGGDQASDEQLEFLQQRVAELEAKLAEARTAGDSADIEQFKREMKSKVKRINAAAQHLSRRRKRLQRARQLLEQRRRQMKSQPQRSPAVPDAQVKANKEEHARRMRAIEQQRRELEEVRSFLANSERELMRRWARPKAVASVGWLVFLVIVAGVGSWFAADVFFPAPVTATVSFTPQSENPREFDAQDAANWQKWHAEYILSREFQEALARRCRDRNLEPYGDVNVLSARLSNDLNLDLSEPRTLTASLDGYDAGDTQLLLDMLASTLSLESSRHMGKRADDAKAVPVGERKEGGRLRYSTLNPPPPIKDRLMFAGPIFAGTMIVLLTVMVIVYTRLARSKRVFEEDLQLFRDEADQGEPVAA